MADMIWESTFEKQHPKEDKSQIIDSLFSPYHK